MSTKSDILAILEKNRDRYLSGQELAESLSLSRTAIWKSIKALETDGHIINAVTNKGYVLEADSDVISPESIRSYLPENLRSLPILVYKTVDSTNTQLKKLALDGAEHGTILVSDEQSAGRGRSGKSFYSPAGTGLYISILLRPKVCGGDPQMITIGAAAAICRAIEELSGMDVQIKWVNDIYLNGKKVCGILTEAVTDFESGGIESIVLGAGINCRAPEGGFPEEISDIACALDVQGLSRSRLVARLVEGIIQSFEGKENTEQLLDEYRKRSFLIGKTVSFVKDGAQLTALVDGIDDKGCLMVCCEDGRRMALSSGEVSVRRK